VPAAVPGLPAPAPSRRGRRPAGLTHRAGEAAAPRWSNEPIGIVLELAEDGTLLTVEPRLDERGKPRPARVPKWFSRSGTGSTANFLWDNAAYVLGLGAKKPVKTARDQAAFKALHLKELTAETDAGPVALCRFLERWEPAGWLAAGLQ
jgi:CRISPR-associated protein Csd1